MHYILQLKIGELALKYTRFELKHFLKKKNRFMFTAGVFFKENICKTILTILTSSLHLYFRTYQDAQINNVEKASNKQYTQNSLIAHCQYFTCWPLQLKKMKILSKIYFTPPKNHVRPNNKYQTPLLRFISIISTSRNCYLDFGSTHLYLCF